MPEYEALAVLGTSFLVGLSGALTPGPLLALDIRESAQGGFWAGPYIATGHSLLELLVVVLLVVGLLQVMEEGPVFTIIALLGGLFLLWMAWSMFKTRARGLPSTLLGPRRSGHYHPVRPILGGAMLSATNPFWSLWWVTVGATFMAETQSLGLGMVGIITFYLGHILSDYSWFSLVSFAVASGRRIMTDAFYKGIVLVCGLFLWGMGWFFIVTGLGRLF